MQPASLIGFAAVYVVVAWSLSVVGLIAHRVVRVRLGQRGPAIERGALELATHLPAAFALLVVGTLGAESLFGADHCEIHHHEAHFCFSHGAPWLHEWWAVGLVALAVGLATARLAPLARQVVQRRRLLAQLRALSRVIDGVRRVETNRPVCFAAAGETYISSGVWNALDPDERAAVLAHEAAHLRHHDVARRLAIEVIGALGAPIQWTRRRWESATERLCDVHAVNVVEDGTIVASAMIKICRLGEQAEALTMQFPPGANALTERVHALMAEPILDERAARRMARAVAVIGGVVGIVVATCADQIHDVLETLLG
jgi:hypothetical protein